MCGLERGSNASGLGMPPSQASRDAIRVVVGHSIRVVVINELIMPLRQCSYTWLYNKVILV